MSLTRIPFYICIMYILYTNIYIQTIYSTIVLYSTILDVRKIDHLDIKTKMFDIEARVFNQNARFNVKHLWYSLASFSERVPPSCFYVKVAFRTASIYNICIAIHLLHFDMTREKFIRERRIVTY